MSIEEADSFMENIYNWETKRAKQEFIRRMEHKLNTKEKYGRK